MGDVGGGLTSIFSLAPSSCFPLIRATFCRALRVRSSLPEEAYQRADSMKNLGAGVGVSVGMASVPVSWAGGRGWACQGPVVGFYLSPLHRDFVNSLSLGPQSSAQLGDDSFSQELSSWVLLGKGSGTGRLETWGKPENWTPWSKSFPSQPQFPHLSDSGTGLGLTFGL